MMDKQQKDDTLTIFPSGSKCEKCGSVQDVQKFDGSYLCKNCRNQYAEMKL